MQNSLKSQAAAELLRRRKARSNLVAYAQSIDVPGKPVSENPDEWLFKPIETGLSLHHVILLNAIQHTMDSRHGRLMVFMPPGSGKSVYTSTVAPTWYMGSNPLSKIILASYGSDLARRHGRRARQIIKSDGYSGIFNSRISSTTSAADEWALENGSEYLAGGILSGITGNRCNGLIIDDPIAGREAAESATIRKKTLDAYNDDLLTRLLPGGWVILIQTRWHEDDLAGSILPKHYDGQSGPIECRDGNIWEVINLPAECERTDDPLGRAIGEMLWPEWFDEKHWAQFRQNSRTWASLFQQRPRPVEGNIFKVDWMRRYESIPQFVHMCVHSWDTANKIREINAPSVGTTWKYARSGGYYLADVFNQRLAYPDLKRAVINMAERDRPDAILIEDKASGQSLIQDLRDSTSLPIISIEPHGDKIFRANEVSSMFEAGLIHLPERASWLTDYEAELYGFPESAFKDQVDSTTQFLQWVKKSGINSEIAVITESIAAGDNW